MCSRKRLSDQFFTFLPECLGHFRIERISTHSFADAGDGLAIWDDFSDMAVLTILATDFASRSDNTGPD
jgi:hypothetical protein